MVLAPIVVPLVIADATEISNTDESAIKEDDEKGLFVSLKESNMKEYADRMSDVLADARQYGWFG